MADLEKVQSALYDIWAEFDAIEDGMEFLNAMLFTGREPGKEYESNYAGLQVMFHFLNNAMHRNSGRLCLIAGEGETAFLKYEREGLEQLAALGEGRDQAETPGVIVKPFWKASGRGEGQ